ncbi:SGNH/GDSL hydrolase family protein [Terriglobus tenax]|uniref:SGNH/GDSL hydrolase family protein n=1 Tax=Terriglobus tenax TaxID=1111115 RepID=UPI0021DF59BD|nr:SGNH/GDSL hydrolase family protein [Terriglobus tenax]
MGRWKSSAWIAVCLFCTSAFAEDSFALHDGDRIVFYGDSITAQQLYTVYAETAIRALHPEWKLRFFNAGVGGDKVSGGVGGAIDERLTRDVFSRQPTVITVMLGMNDRGSDEAALQTYLKGYRHILERFHAEAPKARVLLIGPSPLDDTTRVHDNGNAPLVRYSAAVQQLAKEFGAQFADFNAPVIAALQQAEQQNAVAAVSLIPDRVHPQGAIHLLMAQVLLHAWHYPQNIAEVELDGRKPAVIHADGSHPEHLRSEADGSLSWSELDAPDTIPLGKEDGNVILWRMFAPQPSLGRRMLRVHLPETSRQYQLEIDGKPLGRPVTASELQHGIDIADADTPMRTASRAVYYAAADSQVNQVVRNRLLGPRASGTQAEALLPEAARFFDASVEASQVRADKAATRIEHTFRLLPLAQ